MFIGSHQRVSGLNLTITLDGAALKQVCSTKYLDVYLDQHLTWQVHVNYVFNRVRRKLFAIGQVKTSSQVLQLLYQAYIVPIIDCCDTVWSPSNSTDTRRLERLHSKFSSSIPSSDSFNLHSSLSERRVTVYHTALQVFKIVNNISPSYLHNTFSFAVDVTGCFGRNQHRLFVPRVRTDYGKRLLAYRGQPYGTGYHQHFIVLRLCQPLRNGITCWNFYFCFVWTYIVWYCFQGIAEKQPFG